MFWVTVLRQICLVQIFFSQSLTYFLILLMLSSFSFTFSPLHSTPNLFPWLMKYSWWNISFQKPPDIFAYFRFDRTIEKLRPSSSLALVQERQKWLEREASLWQLWDEQVNQSFRREVWGTSWISRNESKLKSLILTMCHIAWILSPVKWCVGGDGG